MRVAPRPVQPSRPPTAPAPTAAPSSQPVQRPVDTFESAQVASVVNAAG